MSTACIAAACLLALCGCGPAATPIEGVVTLDGQPLSGVQILFDRPDLPGGQSFSGRTNEQGRFALHALDDDSVGDVAGVYRVTLTTAVAERMATEHTPLPPERVPRKYRDGSLTFEVSDGGTTEAEFALKSN